MEKIKPFIKNCVESDKGKDILVVLIVILVGFGSFELGRLSKENSSSGIKILSAQAGEYSAGQANSASAVNFVPKINQNSNNISGNYFASRIGHKYYSVGCSGGATIKESNKVYFITEEEAQKAGYQLSSSCK